MVSVEELKQKFPVKDVPPYGTCIVVPGPDFDPDWEAELDDQGFRCVFTDLDQKAVTLVRLAEKLGSESVEREVSRSPSRALSKYWSSEEDKVLVKLWNEGDLIEKMTPSFPGRTEAAIRLRIQRLEKYGKIKKRTRRQLRADYGFKKKFPRKIVDFAVNLSQSVEPAFSARDIAKKILEKFGVEVSHVAVQKWILKTEKMPSLGEKRRWTEEEDEKLIELWNAKLTVEEIRAEFPSRGETAVKDRLSRLRKKGKVKSRWHKRKKVASEQATSVLEKAIPICEKSVAAAEEILKGCGGVCRVMFEGKVKNSEEGLLSCSTSIGKNLALCLWKQRGDGRFDKFAHFEVGPSGLIMLEGYSRRTSG